MKGESGIATSDDTVLVTPSIAGSKVAYCELMDACMAAKSQASVENNWDAVGINMVAEEE